MGGELYGGNKINIVPDKSVFTIDRRILPEEDIKDVKKEISDVVKRLKQKEKGLKVKIGIISKEKAAVYDKKSKLYDSFSQSILKVLGKKGRRALLTGATDLRFLIRKGIPCAGYSVDGGNTCHCDNEYVKIKSLVDTAKIYADVMANLT
jgi:succinyl-diaminopimelate desuccinylase